MANYVRLEKMALKTTRKLIPDKKVQEFHDMFCKSVVHAAELSKIDDIPVTGRYIGAKKEGGRAEDNFMVEFDTHNKEEQMERVGRALLNRDIAPIVITVGSSAFYKKVKNEEEIEGSLQDENGKAKDADTQECVVICTRCIDGRVAMSMYDIKRKGSGIDKLVPNKEVELKVSLASKKGIETQIIDHVFDGYRKQLMHNTIGEY